MTDEQIIKAYERCFTLGFDESTCYECPFYTATAKCTEDLRDSALDLINRQKAEIERLKTENKIYIEANQVIGHQRDQRDKEINELQKQIDGLDVRENKIKAEAYKEFAERLKGYAIGENGSKEKAYFFVEVQDIDNLVKEMVGEEE